MISLAFLLYLLIGCFVILIGSYILARAYEVNWLPKSITISDCLLIIVLIIAWPFVFLIGLIVCVIACIEWFNGWSKNKIVWKKKNK